MGAACCESDPNLALQDRLPSGGVDRPERPSGSKIKIEYFPASYGRPDPLVQLLEHKGIPYEKVEVTMESWAVRKATKKCGEMGALPIVHRAGKAKQQTNAILRSLGV